MRALEPLTADEAAFVLPAVAEIVLIQQSRAWSNEQIPQFRPVRLLLLLKKELVEVGIRPPHYDLQCAVQLVKLNIPFDQESAPNRRPRAKQGHLDGVNVHRESSSGSRIRLMPPSHATPSTR